MHRTTLRICLSLGLVAGAAGACTIVKDPIGGPMGQAGAMSSGGTGALGGSGSGGRMMGTSGGSGSTPGASGAASTGGTAGAQNGAAGASSVGALTFECGSRDVTGIQVINTDVRTDQTWQGAVLIQGHVDVSDGATVTIAPGTRVIMDVDGELEFGWNSGAATVIAEGTAQAPITFCGKMSGKGYYKSVIFRTNVTSKSVLKNVLFSDGGGKDAAVILEAGITLTDVAVKNSGKDGVWAADFKSGSTGLSITGSNGDAASLTTADAVTHFPRGGSLTGNLRDQVALTFTDIRTDATFSDLGVPYLQSRSVDVHNLASVAYEAGVDYRFAADTYIELGWNSGVASVQANGTAEKPIVFRGATETAGYYQGLIIGENVTSSSKLSHTKIQNAGSRTAYALDVKAPITLSDVTLSTNARGARIGSAGLKNGSTNLVITGTAGVPLTVTPDALISIPTGSYTGNTTDQISVELPVNNYTVQGTVPNRGVPYAVNGGIDLIMGSKMVIEPGTQFVMRADSYFDVGWNSGSAEFIAEGTLAAPIVFKGLSETPGSWKGLQVRGNVLGSSKLTYVTIQHATTGLRLERALPVTNCTFKDLSASGILKATADLSNYATSNTFTNTAGTVISY